MLSHTKINMLKGDSVTGRFKFAVHFHTDIAPVTTDGKKQEQDRNPHSHKEHLKLTHNVLFP